MTKKISTKNLVDYWRKIAKHDYETMLGLYKIKRYSDCLFFGHIVLEKILKALVTAEMQREPPKIHNLVRLAEMADIKLSETELDLLSLANSFNISVRYPDYRLQFYKRYNKRKIAKEKLGQIIKLYRKLCRELSSKKK